MKTLRLAVCFLLMAWLATRTAQAGGVEPHVTTLDNGVTVIIIENHEAPVVALRLYVKTGSMSEGEYLGTGVSHFLEHLVSGGATALRTEEESRKLLDAIGAQSNAYTSRSHTCYHMTTAARYLDTGLELLADWVMNCAIKQEEFDREIQVIQREMDTRASNPARALNDLMSQTMFLTHPIRVPVIGYRSAFTKLKREDVLTYYRRMYVPNNVVFVAAGDIDTQETLAKIRKAFALFERRRVTPVVLPMELPQLGLREAVKEMPVGQAYMRVAFRTVPLSHPDLYPLDLLSFILSRGTSSRLVQKLREEKKLVSSITSWSATPACDAGEFGIQATLDPAKIDEAKEAILEELMLLTRKKVTRKELARAKRQKVTTHIFSLQTVESQAGYVAGDLLSAGDARFGENYVERIQKTTRAELLAVARKYFREEMLCVAVVRPPTKPSQGSGDTAPASERGAVSMVTLENGLRLIVKRNPSQPIVAVRGLFLGGVRLEGDRPGVSLFTARMMRRGAAGMSAEKISRIFDEMGGGFSVASGRNTLYFSATCLAEDLPKAMSVAADVVRRPTFAAEEIERLRPLLIAARKSSKDDWHTELIESFRRKFFKKHPYRNSSLASIDELESITRGDLVQFHGTWCVPNNMVLAVFGDVDPGAVEKLVRRHFWNWPKRYSFEAPPTLAGTGLTESVTIRQASQHPLGALFIGFPGRTVRDKKDGYALQVLDAVVSGIHLPRGWLHQALRGKEQAYVYVVHAYDLPGLDPGYFGVYAGCEPEKLDEVKQIILQQLQRLADEPIPKEEMEAAQRSCITADVLGRQTSGDQAMTAALDELYGLGHDYGREYADGILAVTEAEVKRVAAKYLKRYLCVLMLPEQQPAAGDKVPRP